MEQTIKRLTVRQAIRLQNLIATGPLDRREPVDTELIALGWAELYDDDESVQAVEDAPKKLYDSRGCIQRELMPETWIKQAPLRKRATVGSIDGVLETVIDTNPTEISLDKLKVRHPTVAWVTYQVEVSHDVWVEAGTFYLA